MKFLKRLKSSNFWVSMISAVVLILQAVFNVEIKTEYLNQIIMAILGLLVMSGIVSDSSSDEVTVKQNLDVDAIKENINSMLTQVGSSVEHNIVELVEQIVQNFKHLNADVSKNEEVLTQNATEQTIQQQASFVQPIVAEQIVGQEAIVENDTLQCQTNANIINEPQQQTNINITQTTTTQPENSIQSPNANIL